MWKRHSVSSTSKRESSSNSQSRSRPDYHNTGFLRRKFLKEQYGDSHSLEILNFCHMIEERRSILSG